jgi:hypothetical protein
MLLPVTIELRRAKTQPVERGWFAFWLRSLGEIETPSAGREGHRSPRTSPTGSFGASRQKAEDRLESRPLRTGPLARLSGRALGRCCRIRPTGKPALRRWVSQYGRERQGYGSAALRPAAPPLTLPARTDPGDRRRRAERGSTNGATSGASAGALPRTPRLPPVRANRL